MNKSHLRIGIIGTGPIAKTHARHADAHPKSTVVAVAGSSREKARLFIDDNKLEARAYGSHIDLIEHEALDAVFICLPPFTNHEAYKAAADAGLAIFIEKPIALDRARAKSMVETAQARGVLTMVGFHYRFMGVVERLKTAIESGESGHPALFNGHFFCNSLHAPWWRDLARSGGQVVEQIIHLHDLAMHLFGDVVEVTGRSTNLLHRTTPGYTIEDNCVATLVFANGALGSIASSNCAVPGKWDIGWSAICKNLTVTGSKPNASLWTQTHLDPPQSEHFEESSDPYQREVEHFIQCLWEEAPTRCPIEAGAASLSVALAIRESAGRGGAPVRV